MKQIFLLFLFFIAVCVNAQIKKGIPPKPAASEGLVHDYTNTLTPEQETYLESKLQSYDKSTSNQVAVVLIPTTDGNSIEEAALGILRSWGVGGQADKDNGIVLLVAKDDRKMRIEVGYGLEGAITDYTASSIIENNIVPNFKSGNYYRGIDEAIDKIIEAAAGRYKAPEGYANKKTKAKVVGIIIFFLVIIFSILGSIGKRGGGGMASRRGWGGFGTGWIIGSMMSGGSSGGGSWSGGGGGFGGFGGGGGGGGGASGGW